MRSPLRGGLLVRNPVLRGWLHVGNAGARAWVALRRAMGRDPEAATGRGRPPRRVLLCVGGHLGDAIIATAAIRDLQARIPGVEIGVAASPAGALALEGHPAVRWLHRVPHWRVDRGEGGAVAKFLRARPGRRAAVREIASVGYDAAVDLGAHWPNAGSLLYRAGVPRRIGWTSGGFGAFYTEPVAWEDGDAHESALHRMLVERLAGGDGAPWSGPPRYLLGEGSAKSRGGAARILREAGVDSDYLVLHLGAGAPAKRWPAGRWARLASLLLAEGERVVLTGQGADDAAVADCIQREAAGVARLVDRFTWGELVEVVRGARGVVCADTGVGHVAAGVDTPCVVVFAAIDRPSRWAPAGARVVTLTHEVSCAPCFEGQGCATMPCVREVREDEVLEALRTMVPRHSPMERV